MSEILLRDSAQDRNSIIKGTSIGLIIT